MHISDIQIQNPVVVPEAGRYYRFGSTGKDIRKGPGTGFDGYVSSVAGRLSDFEGPFPVFRPPEDLWPATNFWVPEIHPYQGGWYMLATLKPRKGRRGTGILKSTGSILGPYIPWSCSGPVTPGDWECLDGPFFMEQGIPYLVFCHEWQQAEDGGHGMLFRSVQGTLYLAFHTPNQTPWERPRVIALQEAAGKLGIAGHEEEL